MVGVGHEVDENTTGAVDHLPASRVQECHHHLINWGEKRERGQWSCTQVPSLVTLALLQGPAQVFATCRLIFFVCTGCLGEPGNETNVIPEATLCDPYSAKTF